MESQVQKALGNMRYCEVGDVIGAEPTGLLCSPVTVWPSYSEQWEAREGFEAGKWHEQSQGLKRAPPSTAY